MARTRVKICGITTIEDAFAAVEAGADALGFVHAPGSPRAITPEQACAIGGALPPFVSRVGLFVNPKTALIEQALMDNPFMDVVQLHGREAEPTVREIAGMGIDVIKAVRYDPATVEADLRKWSAINELVAVLIDGSSGGKGQAFDWAAFATVAEACDHPLILAGGLLPENVAEAIRLVSPYAVDVSSGVESAPGVKDPAAMLRFCRIASMYDADE